MTNLKTFRGYTGSYLSTLNPFSQQEDGEGISHRKEIEKCTDGHLVQVIQGPCPVQMDKNFSITYRVCSVHI